MGPELEVAKTTLLPGLAPQGEHWRRQVVFPHCESMAIEIGSGMGEATLAMAQSDPSTGILAVEVHDRGVAALARGVAKARLDNVRIFEGDAVGAIRTRVPEDSVDEIRIWFPDPWPKKRHHKRRLISTDFVDLITPKLVAGGRLHIATDHAGYADWIAHVLGNQRVLEPEVIRGPRPDWRPMTRFEAAGIRAGRVVSDFIYRRPCGQ